MIINCPKCGRELRVESTLFGHLIGCPLCQARFSFPIPSRKAKPSGWQSFLSGLFAPFGAVAKFVEMLWRGLSSDQNCGQAPKYSAGLDMPKEDQDDLYYYDHDEDLDDDFDEDDSGGSPSRSRRYYDSSGTYVGYRDEAGWLHGEGGHNYMGYMKDDGSFYDGSGAYRGQVEDSGLVWEEGAGYTGFHEDNRFSEEGHYGEPDIYEDGGDGTGGAFDSMIDDYDDDDDI